MEKAAGGKRAWHDDRFFRCKKMCIRDRSTFGKTFLCEYPYQGSIRFAGRELNEMGNSVLTGTIGYLGHDPELFDDSIKNNILMGENEDTETYLKAVCFEMCIRDRPG